MPNPPLSVLLPVRDGAVHLGDAIASMEGQVDPDFEVLAVDDGSEDGTHDLLREWAARDRRVRVVRTGPSGIVSALERARALARGDLLARMDADDVAHPRRFALQREFMAGRAEVALCGCGVEYFPAEALGEGARRYEEWINASLTHEEMEREIFVECPVAHPTWVMRAETVDRVGGYRDAGWPEDYDLLLRLWAAGGRLGKVPEVLLKWREGPHRLSRTGRRYTQDAFRRCKAHHLVATVVPEDRPVVVWGAGPVGKGFSRALRRLGRAPTAFVEVDPRKIGQEIHGAPVVDTEGGLARRGAFHLAAVAGPGPRARVRGLLEGAGFLEMRDFTAVA
ncbi:MAG: glycosyltransferase [Gemmatimonadota bacterium]|nr:glycosyltransferase [Gemmatimonadota bacterium]MDH5759194.1 glycosyltransferase [Gemmatimonadota bacterium]